jgi:hypothetical protein
MGAVYTDLDKLLDEQCGVISRRQALGAGLAPHDIRRLLRRREWARVHDGVFVNHTGPLTWLQRAWAAVLFAWPAALCHESALRAADGPGRRDHLYGPIHIAIKRGRGVVAPDGVVAHVHSDIATRAQWNATPPRVRIEEALLDVAADLADEMQVITLLANAIQSRRTTAGRVLSALHRRARFANRRFLSEILTDIEKGTCSALEHAYLIRVERAHQLPTPMRQHAASGFRTLRDIDYAEWGLVIELDGRLFHDHAAAYDADLERDLDAKLAQDRETVRLGWGQVFGRSCETANKVATLLRRRGWTGRAQPCSACATAQWRDSGSPGGSESRHSA